MPRKTILLLVTLVVLLLAAAGAWWWLQRAAPPPALPAAMPPQPITPLASASSAPSAPAAAPASAAWPEMAASAQPPLAQSDAALGDALIARFGRQAVLTLLQTDGFVRRVVATVDNLPGEHAAPRLWPVNPTPGRFAVDPQGRIDAANAARYAPLVKLVGSIDPADAAALYLQFGPLFQQAYEELGYPGKRFRDRLVAVIDHLLATPQPAAPVKLTQTEVKGPIRPLRPWVRWEYADRASQQASAGQRILLRIGEQNRRLLSDWLQRFRAQIAR